MKAMADPMMVAAKTHGAEARDKEPKPGPSG
jgi:hypothetical protein